MKNRIKQRDVWNLVAYVNRKKWWHVPPPANVEAYRERGKFLASTYREAEFYGRPKDIPEKITITNPFICDNQSIEQELLGKIASYEGMSIEEIARIDAKIRVEALKRGHDSIVLLSEKGYKQFRSSGKIPRSIELNIFGPQ